MSQKLDTNDLSGNSTNEGGDILSEYKKTLEGLDLKECRQILDLGCAFGSKSWILDAPSDPLRTS